MLFNPVRSLQLRVTRQSALVPIPAYHEYRFCVSAVQSDPGVPLLCELGPRDLDERLVDQVHEIEDFSGARRPKMNNCNFVSP